MERRENRFNYFALQQAYTVFVGFKYIYVTHIMENKSKCKLLNKLFIQEFIIFDVGFRDSL